MAAIAQRKWSIDMKSMLLLLHAVGTGSFLSLFRCLLFSNRIFCRAMFSEKVVYLEIYHFDFSQIILCTISKGKTLYSYCFHLLNRFVFKVHLNLCSKHKQIHLIRLKNKIAMLPSFCASQTGLYSTMWTMWKWWKKLFDCEIPLWLPSV